MSTTQLTVRDYIEAVAAVHCSSYVAGEFPERGGLMIVGPPAVLKSTFLEILDRHYHDALALSDVNAKSLAALRDAIANGRIRTLLFPEFAKLYERKADTAANVEGVLRAFAAEGFSSASFDDARISRLRARATIIAAMTPGEQRTHFERWENSGFNRRFLWSLIGLEDPTVLQQAVIEWRRIEFRVGTLPLVPIEKRRIPNTTTRAERTQLRNLCKYQPGGDQTVQMQMLVKMLAVLRWSYEESGDRRDPMATVMRFAATLGKHGALLSLDPPRRDLKREEQEVAHVAAHLLNVARWRKQKPRRNRAGSSPRKAAKASRRKQGARHAR